MPCAAPAPTRDRSAAARPAPVRRALAVALVLALSLAAAAGVHAQADTAAPAAVLAPVEPRVEVLEPGGANRPYRHRGRWRAAHARDEPLVETGLASWYGAAFHGRRTASGERFDMHAYTAAHPTMPLPSWALVHNPANGRRLVVRVNDRGPFSPGRVIDLSRAAARALGVQGLARVTVERLTHDAIRTGAWRRLPGPADDPASVAATALADAKPTPAPRVAPGDDPAGPRDDGVVVDDPG